MWKWLRRLTLGLVAVVVLTLIAGVVTFQSSWLRDRLRRAAMSQADKLLSGHLTIGRLSGSLLQGVVLDDVRVGQDGGQLFAAQRIVVTYDVMNFVHRHWVLGDILVERPTISITQSGAGWNVGHLLKPRPSTGPPLEIEIQRLRVRDADVMIIPAAGASRHLEAVNADTTLTRHNGTLSIAVAAATLHDDTSGYDVRELAGTLTDGIRVVDVTVAASRAGATVGGRVRVSPGPDGPTLETNIDLARVNLHSFLADPRWRSDITAHVDLQGVVAASLENARLTFQVTSPNARAFGYEGQHITAKGRLTGGMLSFDASASGYGASATIGATWQVASGAGRTLAFDGQGAFHDVALPALPAQVRLPPLESHLAGQYHVHVGRHEWRADVVLDESSVEGGTIAAGTTGFITGHAGVTTYSATGSVADMDLRRLAAPLDVPSLAADRYRSRLSGTFAITGQELCRDCAVPRVIIASAEMASASFADARLTNVEGGMTLAGSRLSATGHGEVEHLTGEALGWLASPSLDVNGRVDGSLVLPDVHAPTTVSNVEASGAVNLTASTIGGVAVDATSGSASLRDGLLELRQFVTRGAGLRADANGTLAMGDNGVSALDVTIDSDDLAALGTWVGQPIGGAGHVEAHVTGQHDSPEATGKASFRGLKYDTDASALTFNGDFTAAMPQWQPSRATVSATTEAAFVTVKSLDITKLSGHAAYHDGRVDLDADLVDASRELKFTGQATLGSPDRTLQIRTLSLTTAGQTWALQGGHEATMRVNGERVDVQGLVLAKDAATVTADGAMALKSVAGSPADALRLKVDRVQLSDLNQVLLGERQLTGVLNGLVTITGTPDDPAAEGHIDVTDGKVQTTPFASFTADGKLAAHDLTLNASLVQSAGVELKASGHLPVGAGSLASPRPMEIKITSPPIDLGLAQLLTESATKIGGTGQLDLTLTGSPQDPVVDGTVKIDAGRFTLAGTGVSYRDVVAGLTFKANHLAIDALRLSDDDGHQMQAVGGIDLLGDPTKRAFDVKVTGRGVHVLNNAMGTMQMNADVELSGDFAAPKVTGKITLESGRLQVDQILERTTKSAYSETAQAGLAAAVEPGAASGAAGGGTAVSANGDTTPAPASDVTAPPAAKKSVFERVIVDLSVNLPDNLVMRGRGLRVGSSSIGLGDMNVIAGGQLRIVKASGEPPSVVGDVQIVRGTYSFQGRAFDVERGSTVGFHGSDVANPTVDVSGSRDVNGIDATVHVKGTAKRPQVSLSSQPPLDEAEILSLIVFGQSVGDLGQSQRTSLAASAGAMAAGTITTPLADSVARALDLDTFEILAPTDTESMPVVSLGSTIGSRIYVGVKREIGGDSSAVSFEYRFTRFLRLVTSFAQGALQAHALERAEAGGIDLLFVFRY